MKNVSCAQLTPGTPVFFTLYVITLRLIQSIMKYRENKRIQKIPIGPHNYVVL
jgi:hypothetical protein